MLQAEYEWKVGQLQQHVQEQQQQCTTLTTRLQAAQQVCTHIMLLCKSCTHIGIES